MELSHKSLPPMSVEQLDQAFVHKLNKSSEYVSGVFRQDGSFCHLSRTLLSGEKLSGVPELTEWPFAEVTPGKWLFAGIGRHHFGHFLVETIIRLWAVGQFRDELDGITIVPVHGGNFSIPLVRRYKEFLSMLTGDLPIYLADYHTRFEKLVVPSPGFGPLAWSEGTPIFRKEVRSRIKRGIQPDGHKKLYISRSQLQHPEKRLFEEEKIEDLMRAAGYHIFHPEKHSIVEQIKRYRAADTIVGGDGSAFHLVPFAMPEGGRVGLINRRHRPKVFNAFEVQCRSFANADVTPIHAVLPKTSATPHPSQAPAPMNLELLAGELSSAGLI